LRRGRLLQRTHGRALDTPSDDAAVIAKAALEALDGLATERPVRLLGVRADLADPADIADVADVT